MANNNNPDLVIRVAANIESLKADMAQAAATLKLVEAATTATAGATTGLKGGMDDLGHSFVGRVAEGMMLRDALRELMAYTKELVIGIPEEALALRNLSLQTQISIEDLQLITAASREFGVEGDQLGRALFQLSQRIAGGDANVSTAYHLMGMSLDEVRDKSPVDLLLATEHGLGTLSGAIQDTAAKDLYGARLGASMIAFSHGADDAMEKARALNTIASKDSVEAAAKYAEAVDRMTHSVHAWVMELEGKAAQGFNTLTDAVDKGASKWSLFVAMLKDWAGSSIQTGASATNLATLLDHLNLQADHGKDIVLEGNKAHTEAVVVLSAHEQAARFMAATELDSAKPILDWQTEYLLHLKEIGLLSAQNAAGIGVNVDQLKNFEAGLAAAAKAHAALLVEQKKAAEIEAKAIEETTKLWDQYDLLRVEHSGTATDIQIAQVDRWAADLTARMVKAKADTAGFYEALAAVSKEKTDAILVDLKALNAANSDLYQATLRDAAEKAQRTFEIARDAISGYSQEDIGRFHDIALAAADAAGHWQESFETAGAASTHAVTASADAAVAALKTIDDAAAKAKADQRTQQLMGGVVTSYQNETDWTKIPLGVRNAMEAARLGMHSDASNYFLGGMAEGGPVSPGHSYWVGEKEPELFVPQTAGTIVPHGGGGQTIQIYITQPLGTPSAIAAAVDAALMARQRNSGQRMPVA